MQQLVTHFPTNCLDQVSNPGPQGPLSCVLDVSLLQNTGFKWMDVDQAQQKPDNDHSFQSGVLDQGNV